MIGGLQRALDSLFGRGEAAVTVPPLDGALRPNRALDEATERFPLDGVDSLAVVGGRLVASAGRSLYRLEGADWHEHAAHDAAVAAICPIGEDGLAVALTTGKIVVAGGQFDGRRYTASDKLGCITAIVADGAALYVANGSATNGADAWERDLLERNASGSLWRIDLASGASTRLSSGLAWPAGLSVSAGALTFSEAWKHHIARLEIARPATPQLLYSDLPAYPGRLAPAVDGFWLALFAPRSQLVEFVLREPGYRRRMMAEVPQSFWVSPKLRSGRSFYESLQGGGVKHLGMLKPWAPTMSAGLCVRLDSAFQPRSSVQSRADGGTHGVTAMVEHQGRLFVAARGDGVVVALPLADIGDEA
ncbi:MAG: strictosidine synthase [Rhizobiaceae bacterium]